MMSITKKQNNDKRWLQNKSSDKWLILIEVETGFFISHWFSFYQQLKISMLIIVKDIVNEAKAINSFSKTI